MILSTPAKSISSITLQVLTVHTSVSYTHLDVYKRQAIYRAQEMGAADHALPAAAYEDIFRIVGHAYHLVRHDLVGMANYSKNI